MLFTNKTVKKFNYLFACFCVYWFLFVIKVQAQEHARADTLPAFRDTLILSKFDSSKIKTSKNSTEAEPIIKKNKRLSAGPGIGMMNFYGDIRAKNLGDPNSNRFAFSFDVKKELASKIDLGVHFVTGKLAGNEYSKEYRNFESKINQFSINLIYRLFSEKKGEFKPYLFSGINTFLFKSYTDLIDENGNTYYYWTDGLIYDKSESDANAAKARLLKRDYVYETELASTKSAIGGLAGIGLQVAVTPKVDINFTTAYNYSFTDKIDNYSEGLTDQFAFTSIGFIYKISPKSEEDMQYKTPKDSALIAFENTDNDNDGIIDFYDQCPNTPSNIMVNKSGCPVDKDNDGIPDHKDEEKKTTKNVMVDMKGTEITKGLGFTMLDYRSRTDSSLIRSEGDTTKKTGSEVLTHLEITVSSTPDTSIQKTNEVHHDSVAALTPVAEPLLPKDTLAKLAISINTNIDTIDSATLITKKQDTLTIQPDTVTKKHTDASIVAVNNNDTSSSKESKIEEHSSTMEQKQTSTTETVTEPQLAKESQPSTTESAANVEPTVNVEVQIEKESQKTENIITETEKKVDIKEEQQSTEQITISKETPSIVEAVKLYDDTLPAVFKDSLVLAESEEQDPLKNNLMDGIIFSINIGAFQNEIPERFFQKLKLTLVRTEPGPGNTQYYIVGQYRNIKDAAIIKKDMKYVGFDEAEIVAYNNGEKMDLKEAIEITGE